MRRSLLIIFAMLLFVLSPTPSLSAQESEEIDPTTIALASYIAINDGDLDASIQFVTEETVSVTLPPPPGRTPSSVGIEPARAVGEYLIGNNAHFTISNVEVAGNTVTYNVTLVEDFFLLVGSGPIGFTGTRVVKDGEIVSSTLVMKPEDEARLDAAVARFENKIALRRGYEEGFNNGNLDFLDDDIAADAVDHSFPDVSGPEAFKLGIAGLREAFPDIQATADMVVAEGDLVMAVATFTGTHEGEFLGVAPTGKQVTWTHVDINRFENGQVVEAWHIGTPAVILDALTAESE